LLQVEDTFVGKRYGYILAVFCVLGPGNTSQLESPVRRSSNIEHTKCRILVKRLGRLIVLGCMKSLAFEPGLTLNEIDNDNLL
jgi:hypothetical protein